MLQSGRIERVIAAGIEPTHFHNYRAEWEYLLDQYARHGEIPPPKMFKEKFPDFVYRKQVGKEPNVMPAIEAVRDNHLEMSLAQMADDFVDSLGQKPPNELIAELTARIDSLRAQDAGEEQIDLIEDMMADYDEFVRLQTAEEDGRSAFVPAPWQPINDYWGGLRGGEVIGIIARMNEGKSWVSQQMATVALLGGKRALFVPLEMGRYDVAARLHTMLSYYHAKHLSPKHMRLPAITNRKRVEEMMEGRTVWSNMALSVGSSKIDRDEYKEWITFMRSTIKSGFVVPNLHSFSGQFTFDTFARHVERSECDIAVLDYMTLLDDGAIATKKQDWEVWKEVTRRAKVLALRLDIPIIICAQANRQGAYSKTPELTDIAYSDALGQNADRILSLKTTGNTTQVTCIKNRKGQNRFRFWCHFYPDMGIVEYDHHRGVDEMIDEE